MPTKNNLSYAERKKLLDFVIKSKKEIHKMHMKELEYQRESDLMHHNNEMTRQRIKSAEIRKAQERKEWKNFHNERRG